ncbi:hypothetical protein D3C75_900860 [compost metagenome]
MDVDHPHTHLRSGFNRHGSGVGNVVEFQIEEHLKALLDQGFDNARCAAGEQLLADLDPAQGRIELIRQFQGGVTGREIQGDNDGRLAGGHGRVSWQVLNGAHCKRSRGLWGPMIANWPTSGGAPIIEPMNEALAPI